MGNISKNKLFVTDYDGTLADNDSRVSDVTIDELKRIGELGIIRVVATGRSFFSFKQAVGEEFPVDYLICSSGIGIYDWSEKKLLSKNEISKSYTDKVYSYLIDNGYDFMVQLPLPDNHFFHHFYSEIYENQDFFNRVEKYKAAGLDLVEKCPDTASQFVVILPENNNQFEILSEEFKNLSIVKATSPLDGKSIWIEILPSGITKASGIQFLKDKLNIARENIISVGNDYYDLHMLKYTLQQNSYIVSNAPEDLIKDFNVIGANFENGVANLLKKIY